MLSYGDNTFLRLDSVDSRSWLVFADATLGCPLMSDVELTLSLRLVELKGYRARQYVADRD